MSSWSQYKSLVMHRVSVQKLIEQLHAKIQLFIRQEWVPRAVEHLAEKRSHVQRQLDELGPPPQEVKIQSVLMNVLTRSWKALQSQLTVDGVLGHLGKG